MRHAVIDGVEDIALEECGREQPMPMAVEVPLRIFVTNRCQERAPTREEPNAVVAKDAVSRRRARVNGMDGLQRLDELGPERAVRGGGNWVSGVPAVRCEIA